MSVTTIPPTDKMFCKHCNHQSTKEVGDYELEGQYYHLYLCPKCKENTLIRFDLTYCTLFKVES